MPLRNNSVLWSIAFMLNVELDFFAIYPNMLWSIDLKKFAMAVKNLFTNPVDCVDAVGLPVVALAVASAALGFACAGRFGANPPCGLDLPCSGLGTVITLPFGNVDGLNSRGVKDPLPPIPFPPPPVAP